MNKLFVPTLLFTFSLASCVLNAGVPCENVDLKKSLEVLSKNQKFSDLFNGEMDMLLGDGDTSIRFPSVPKVSDLPDVFRSILFSTSSENNSQGAEISISDTCDYLIMIPVLEVQDKKNTGEVKLEFILKFERTAVNYELNPNWILKEFSFLEKHEVKTYEPAVSVGSN